MSRYMTMILKYSRPAHLSIEGAIRLCSPSLGELSASALTRAEGQLRDQGILYTTRTTPPDGGELDGAAAAARMISQALWNRATDRRDCHQRRY